VRKQIFCKRRKARSRISHCTCAAGAGKCVVAGRRYYFKLRPTWSPCRAWSPLLAGVSRGHRAHAGATLRNQYTLAGVNRAWQGIWPEQGRGCSTIITARCLYWSIFFGMEEKIGTFPYIMCLASKKGSKTDETDDSALILTTLLLTPPCRFVKNPLLVPTDNCNSTFLLRGTTPRDVTWQNFWHGKIVSRKNSSSLKYSPLEEKREHFSWGYNFFFKWGLFWMFVGRKPLFPHRRLGCPLPLL